MIQTPLYIGRGPTNVQSKWWENSNVRGLKLAPILESQGKHDQGVVHVTLFRFRIDLG